MSSCLSRLHTTSRAPFAAETVRTWHAGLSVHRAQQTNQWAWAVDTVGLVALSGQMQLCQSALFRHADAFCAPAASQGAAEPGIEHPFGLSDAAGALASSVGAALVLVGQTVLSAAFFVVYGASELLVSVCWRIWDSIHRDPPEQVAPLCPRPAAPLDAYAPSGASPDEQSLLPTSIPEPTLCDPEAGAAPQVYGVPLRRVSAPRGGLESSSKTIGKLARRLGTVENKQESARDSAARWSDQAREAPTHLAAEVYQSWVHSILAAEVANLSTKYRDVTNVACGALSELNRVARRLDASPSEQQVLTPSQLAPIRVLFYETKRSLAVAKADLEAMHVHYQRAQSAMMAFNRFTARDIDALQKTPFYMENMMGSGLVEAKTHGDLVAMRGATHKFFFATTNLFHTIIPKAISDLSQLQTSAGHMVRLSRFSGLRQQQGVPHDD